MASVSKGILRQLPSSSRRRNSGNASSIHYPISLRICQEPWLYCNSQTRLLETMAQRSMPYHSLPQQSQQWDQQKLEENQRQKPKQKQVAAFQSLIGTLAQACQRFWMNPPNPPSALQPRSASSPLRRPIVETQISETPSFLHSWLERFGKLGIAAMVESPPARKNNHPLLKQLKNLVYRKKSQPALRAYRRLREIENVWIERKVIENLIRCLESAERPLDCFAVFSDYREQYYLPSLETDGGHNDKDLHTYRVLMERLIDSLRHVGDQRIEKNRQQAEHAMRVIVLEWIPELPADMRHSVYAVLMASLLKQRQATLAEPYIQPLFRTLWANRDRMTVGFWKHILSLIRYNRRREIPYAHVLHHVVSTTKAQTAAADDGDTTGGTETPVHPAVVLQLVDHLFPYENTRDVRLILQSLIELQATSDDASSDYHIDVGAIDGLAHACSRTKSHHNSLLLWDLWESQSSDCDNGPPPPMSLYEATALTLAASMSRRRGRHHNDSSRGEDLWLLLQEFHQIHGEISRPLMSSLARIFRQRPRDLSQVQRAWQEHQRNRSDGHRLQPQGSQDFEASTVACLNVLLCAFAARGNVRTMETLWGEFARNQWTPTLDSYSYMLEGLARRCQWITSIPITGEEVPPGKKVPDREQTPTEKEDSLNQLLATADRLLTQMEEEQQVRVIRQQSDDSVGPMTNEYVLRSYVELLCSAGKVNVAVDVVKECQVANPKTVHRVVKTMLSTPRSGDSVGIIQTAKALAERLPEPYPVLELLISNAEGRQRQKSCRKK